MKYGIIKFFEQGEEENVEDIIEQCEEEGVSLYLVSIGKSNINSDYEEKLTPKVINKYLKNAFNEENTHMTIIYPNIYCNLKDIKALVNPFKKFTRLGISYSQVYEENKDYTKSYFYEYEFDETPYTKPTAIDKRVMYDHCSPLFVGNCYCISKECYDEVLGINEDFKSLYYNLDLSIKATKNKFRIVCAAKSLVESLNKDTNNWVYNSSEEEFEEDCNLINELHGYDLTDYNQIQPKTIVECQIFNQEHLLEAWLINASAYADEIIVLYTKEPWGHNPLANGKFEVDGSYEILMRYKEILGDQLYVIEGDWKDETYERNLGLYYAKMFGGKWLLIVDCDEFYLKEDMINCFDYMLDNPSDVWVMNCIQLVKKRNLAAFPEEGYPLANFCIDIESGQYFLATRVLHGQNQLIPYEVCKCYHFSYALPKDRLDQKMMTSFHVIEFIPGWYENIWPTINDNSVNCHPTHPKAWSYMRRVDIPEIILKDIEYLKSPEFD
ncbi:MAG: hypothetical protein ACRC7N_17020 [Clostridium sp.]